MNKPFKHTKKSLRRCRRCNKPMKANLIARKPEANECYNCFMKHTRNHPSYNKETINSMSDKITNKLLS